MKVGQKFVDTGKKTNFKQGEIPQPHLKVHLKLQCPQIILNIFY